ncbi:MAG: BrnT family toxin [Candidatus Binataceae bacterium]|nr:BrnT family toxin [Candidatus Binataceae bacterium]
MTRLSFTGFQWDRANRLKCEKHGVPIAAIEELFRRPVAIFPDPAHSDQEERFKAIGKTDDRRSVLMVFTLRRRRADVFIRLISARYMHKREVDHYEKEAARAQER